MGTESANPAVSHNWYESGVVYSLHSGPGRQPSNGGSAGAVADGGSGGNNVNVSLDLGGGPGIGLNQF